MLVPSSVHKPPRIVGDLAYIELSRGKEAVIDLADLPLQGDTGQTIAKYLALSQTDMLVMGAYAHSRLRQLVLGGVTATNLSNPAVMTLMSH